MNQCLQVIAVSLTSLLQAADLNLLGDNLIVSFRYDDVNLILSLQSEPWEPFRATQLGGPTPFRFRPIPLGRKRLENKLQHLLADLLC